LSTVICPAPYSFGLSFVLVIYSLAFRRQKSTPKTHRTWSVAQIRKSNPKLPSTQQSGAFLRYFPSTTYKSCCVGLAEPPEPAETRSHFVRGPKVTDQVAADQSGPPNHSESSSRASQASEGSTALEGVDGRDAGIKNAPNPSHPPSLSVPELSRRLSTPCSIRGAECAARKGSRGGSRRTKIRVP